jgi:hypothetical protein
VESLSTNRASTSHTPFTPNVEVAVVASLHRCRAMHSMQPDRGRCNPATMQCQGEPRHFPLAHPRRRLVLGRPIVSRGQPRSRIVFGHRGQKAPTPGKDAPVLSGHASISRQNRCVALPIRAGGRHGTRNAKKFLASFAQPRVGRASLGGLILPVCETGRHEANSSRKEGSRTLARPGCRCSPREPRSLQTVMRQPLSKTSREVPLCRVC